jgi:hypothetical protein
MSESYIEVFPLTQIICVSHELWDAAPCRVQNLLQWLPNAEVLFFEPEQPLLSRFRRPREGFRVSENVIAFTLPCSIPVNEEASARLVRQSKRNAAFMRKCIQERGFDRPVLWLRCPDQVEVAFELRQQCKGLIYDCDRAWKEFPREWESILCEEADVSFAASESIRNRLSAYSDNVALIPNGLDYSLFMQAAKKYTSFPADLQAISAPIFGFLGEVTDFTQLAPIYHAATAHPNWQFVFVGAYSRRNAGYPQLKRLGNVHFLGAKSLPSLPRYLAKFDVCLGLLDERLPVLETVSEQLYRYLASGKPAVMMQTEGELSYFPDVIYTAHFDIEFEQVCQQALEEDSSAMAQRRIQYASESDWRSRGQELVQILDTNGFL